MKKKNNDFQEWHQGTAGSYSPPLEHASPPSEGNPENRILPPAGKFLAPPLMAPKVQV